MRADHCKLKIRLSTAFALAGGGKAAGRRPPVQRNMAGPQAVFAEHHLRGLGEKELCGAVCHEYAHTGNRRRYFEAGSFPPDRGASGAPVAAAPFLYGKSPSAIASYLTDEGIKTPGGKTIWRSKTVESILSNEKYKGDALLQKKFTIDFLTKKSKINEGEVPQYYVANSHPAIIEPELFDLVQYELKQRKQDGRFTSCAYPFSGKIICGECGGIYGSKVWHSNTPNRTLVWQCNEKNRGQHCKTPHLTEANIQAAFLIAFNRILGKREEIIEAYHEVMEALTDTTDLDTEREQLQSECEVVMGLIRKVIEDNAQKAMDQAEYEKKYTRHYNQYEKARQRMAAIEELRLERNAKRTKMAMFLERLTGCSELVTEFDEELWYSTVDSVTVYKDGRMVFAFRDGKKITVKREAWEAA